MSRGASRLRMRLRSAAESKVRAGHPWVFSESVRDLNREGVSGELAVIYDRRDRFLAIGLYDPDSPLRVRVLHRGKPETLDEAWWRNRLRAALALRQSLFEDRVTTGFRMINGESDGWPGLVLDRYDRVLVLKLYTAAWLARLDEIVPLLRQEIECAGIVLRLSRNIHARAATLGHIEGDILGGEPGFPEGVRDTSVSPTVASGLPDRDPGGQGGGVPWTTTFQEWGLTFEVDVVRGQKTGFFLDQRENRRRVGTLAAGRRVLNAFSFSGGFSLHAARGGAVAVTDLDISGHALESAERNFRWNASLPEVRECRHERVQADAFEWLSGARPSRYDLVVLDPPSLARRETEREGALQAYANLAFAGGRLLSRNGILMASSCSAHVAAEEFFDVVRSAVNRLGKRVEELERTGHPSDHPATFPEARYLKGIFLRLA